MGQPGKKCKITERSKERRELLPLSAKSISGTHELIVRRIIMKCFIQVIRVVGALMSTIGTANITNHSMVE